MKRAFSDRPHTLPNPSGPWVEELKREGIPLTGPRNATNIRSLFAQLYLGHYLSHEFVMPVALKNRRGSRSVTTYLSCDLAVEFAVRSGAKPRRKTVLQASNIPRDVGLPIRFGTSNGRLRQITGLSGWLETTTNPFRHALAQLHFELHVNLREGTYYAISRRAIAFYCAKASVVLRQFSDNNCTPTSRLEKSTKRAKLIHEIMSETFARRYQLDFPYSAAQLCEWIRTTEEKAQFLEEDSLYTSNLMQVLATA